MASGLARMLIFYGCVFLPLTAYCRYDARNYVRMAHIIHNLDKLKSKYIMNQLSPYKKLYRSRKERMIAGICGGLAAHFGIDPTWVRLIFVLFFFAGGAALFIYLILARTQLEL